jgi:hypothetical protein
MKDTGAFCKENVKVSGERASSSSRTDEFHGMEISMEFGSQADDERGLARMFHE